MKIIVVVALSLMCHIVAVGQEIYLDSLLHRASLQLKADSINVVQWSDNVLTKIRTKFKADSLRSLPSDSLDHSFSQSVFMQRLIHERDSAALVIGSKRDSMMQKIHGSWQSWKGKLSTVRTGGDFSIEDFPDRVMPQFPEVNLNDDLNLRNLNLNRFNISERMSSAMRMEFKIPEMPTVLDRDVFDPLGAVKSDPGKALEAHMLSTQPVSKMTDYLRSGEAVSGEWTSRVRTLRDPDSLKKLVREELVKQSLNHFARKQTAVHQALQKVSKYKARYSQVSSLTEIPSLPKNTMHGKPFSERFIPGFAIQYQRSNDARLDLNPYAMYRVTGRFSVGAGWSNRTQVLIGNNHISMRSPAFGPRIFSEFKTWGAISGRVELEGMRTSSLRPHEESGGEWSVILRVGLKTEYRLYRNVKGIAQIMMPVSMSGTAYVHRELFTRFGFEFPLKG